MPHGANPYDLRPTASPWKSPIGCFGLNRRRLLALAGLGGFGLVGARLALPWWLRRPPPRAPSAAAAAFAQRKLAGLDLAKIWDVHAHVVGVGAGGSGCWVNPGMQSHWHPVERLQFDVYRAASGIETLEGGDQQYLERLIALQRLANPRGKLLTLAFEQNVREDGTVDEASSTFHVPDAYVSKLAREHVELVPCASVHPYRKDAIARLERAAEAGARAVKWLPNSMGMDPASPRCDAFYERLAALRLPLLCHTGKESAVSAAAAQELGNPQRLRRALDRGVRVIAAHCASLGRCEDLESPMPRHARCFDLLLRMMGEAQYKGRLYADISATVFVNRDADVLPTLLSSSDLHPSLLYGSDYPLVAIDPLISTWWLARKGLLAKEDKPLLDELFEANPLLFDLVLKRCLRVVRDGRELRFADDVFETARAFGR